MNKHCRLDSSSRASRVQQIVTLVGVIVPFLGLAGAILLLWERGFHWPDLGLLVGMYLLTGLGITIGYHRLFAHRSFNTYRPVKWLLAIVGGMALEGPLLKWTAIHRRHHQHSDREEDPHSPNHHGGGVRGTLTGFWHAHIAWMFRKDPPDLPAAVPDLYADRPLRIISKLFGVWALLGLMIPTAIGGLLTGTWPGAFTGLLWGGLTRIFLVHHVTWSINSVCHLWGTRRFEGRDHSRNNFLFGVLGLGEGWHNNHHAFPSSARHGMRWWELDLSYLIIRKMKLLGLAWSVRVPSPKAIRSQSRYLTADSVRSRVQERN